MIRTYLTANRVYFLVPMMVEAQSANKMKPPVLSTCYITNHFVPITIIVLVGVGKGGAY